MQSQDKPITLACQGVTSIFSINKSDQIESAVILDKNGENHRNLCQKPLEIAQIKSDDENSTALLESPNLTLSVKTRGRSVHESGKGGGGSGVSINGAPLGLKATHTQTTERFVCSRAGQTRGALNSTHVVNNVNDNVDHARIRATQHSRPMAANDSATAHGLHSLDTPSTNPNSTHPDTNLSPVVSQYLKSSDILVSTDRGTESVLYSSKVEKLKCDKNSASGDIGSDINVDGSESDSDIDVGVETMATGVAVSYQYSITKGTEQSRTQAGSRKVHATTYTPEIGTLSGPGTAPSPVTSRVAMTTVSTSPVTTQQSNTSCSSSSNSIAHVQTVTNGDSLGESSNLKRSKGPLQSADLTHDSVTIETEVSTMTESNVESENSVLDLSLSMKDKTENNMDKTRKRNIVKSRDKSNSITPLSDANEQRKCTAISPPQLAPIDRKSPTENTTKKKLETAREKSSTDKVRVPESIPNWRDAAIADPFGPSSCYLSFDPRILQFYSEDDRRKLVESRFIPPGYSPTTSTKNVAFPELLHNLGNRVSETVGLSVANPLLTDFPKQSVHEHLLPSSLITKTRNSSTSLRENHHISDKTARKLTLGDKPSHSFSKDTSYNRHWQPMDTTKNLSRSDHGKLCDRDGARNRATPPLQQSTVATKVGIVIARKRPDSRDRKEGDRQRLVTSSTQVSGTQHTEPSVTTRQNTRSSNTSGAGASALTSNLIVTGGGPSAISQATNDRPIAHKPRTASAQHPVSEAGGYWLGNGVYRSRDGAETQYNPPHGYKITQDPLTRQLYIIPDVGASYYGALSPQQPSPVASSRSPSERSESGRTSTTPALLSPPPDSRRTPASLLSPTTLHAIQRQDSTDSRRTPASLLSPTTLHAIQRQDSTDSRKTPTSLLGPSTLHALQRQDSADSRRTPTSLLGPSTLHALQRQDSADSRRTPTSLLGPTTLHAIQRQDSASTSGLISPGSTTKSSLFDPHTNTRRDLLSPLPSGRKTPTSSTATSTMAAPALMPPHPYMPGVPIPPAPHPYGYPYAYAPYFWTPSAAYPPQSTRTSPKWPTTQMVNRGTSPVDVAKKKRMTPPKQSNNVTVQTVQTSVTEACVQTEDLITENAIKVERVDTEVLPRKTFMDMCVQTDKQPSDSVRDEVVGDKCPRCNCSCQMDKSKSAIKEENLTSNSLSNETNSSQTHDQNRGVSPTQSSSKTDLGTNSMDALHILSTLALRSTVPLPEATPRRHVRDLTRPLSIETNLDYMSSQRYGIASRSPDLSSDYNVPKSIYFREEFIQRRPSKASSVSEDEISSVFRIGTGPENMDPKEIEVRTKLADIQRQYKEKQKQFAKLKPKSKDADGKKSPGKLSKRRNSSKSQTKEDKSVPLTGTSLPASTPTKTENTDSKPISCPRTKAQLKYMQPPARTSAVMSGVRHTRTIHSFSHDSARTSAVMSGVRHTRTIHSFSHDSDMGELSSLLEDTCLEANRSKVQRCAKKKLPFSSSFHDSASNSSRNRSNTSSLGILAAYASSQIEDAQPITNKLKKRHKQSAKSDDCSDIPSKKRKPGRPKKYSKDQAITQTLVSKSSKNFSFFNMGKSVKRMKAFKEGNKSSILQAITDWNRRRSELSDTAPSAKSPCSSTSSVSAIDSTTPCSPIKPSVLSRHVLARSVSVGGKPRVPTLAERVVRPGVMKGAQQLGHKLKTFTKQLSQQTPSSTEARDRYRFHSDSSECDTDSDDSSSCSDAPLRNMATDTPTSPESLADSRPSSPVPEIRSSVLQQSDLVDGLSVLYFMEGLFYEARVKNIQPPDVYGVTVKGERGNRPHILPREELLHDAVMDIRPPSLGNVPVGRRVCAYWSQQFSCLYPGVIVKATPLVKGGGSKHQKLVNVEFDDGDDGKIPLEHIRLLPQDFPIQSYDDDPPSPGAGKRKRGSISEDLLADKPSLSDTVTRFQVTERLKAVAKRKMELYNENQTRKGQIEGVHNDNISDTMSVHSSSKARHSSVSPVPSKGGNPARMFDRSLSVGAKSKTKSKLNSPAKKAKRDSQWLSDCDSDSDSPSALSDAFSDGDTVTASTSRKAASTSKSPKKAASKVTTPRRKSEGAKARSQSTSSVKKRECKKSTASASALNAHQIWKWLDAGTKRPKKTFHKAIRRGNEILRLGDCAVFLTVGRPNLPYIGRIETLFETRGGKGGGDFTVKVKWFYHPEETKGGKRLTQIKGALYESPHGDENDVQTISHRCDVMSYTRYKAYKAQHAQADMDNIYYLAGFYDPTSNLLKFEGDVKVQGKNW